LNGLKNSRFTFIPSSGTYFQILDYSNISQEPDVDFVHRLAREYGVGGIPISVFNINQTDHKQLRFCFAKKDETLIEAANRLSKV
jgi:methionine aminotransferase